MDKLYQQESNDGFTCNGMYMQLADFNVDGKLDLESLPVPKWGRLSRQDLKHGSVPLTEHQHASEFPGHFSRYRRDGCRF